MKSQLFSGARGQLTIKGLKGDITMAYVTDVSINVTNSVRPVHTFGAVNARSVEPLSTACTVSIGRVVPVNKSSGSSSAETLDTSAIANGIEATINSMIQAEDISIELKDKITGSTIAMVNNCRFTGRSFSVGAGNVANERISLIGIYDSANGNTANVGL